MTGKLRRLTLYMPKVGVSWSSSYKVKNVHTVLQVSKQPNGLVVASYENNSPLTRIAVVYNAGSRYEDPGNEGIAHCLRTLSDLVSI